MWIASFLTEAAEEREGLPIAERIALDRALQKLEAFGPTLPFPHQSAVRGVKDLRELRPRSGRSPWRAFYRRIGDGFIIAAVGPEAKVDPRGFERAVRHALRRLEGRAG